MDLSLLSFINLSEAASHGRSRRFYCRLFLYCNLMLTADWRETVLHERGKWEKKEKRNVSGVHFRQ